MAGQKKLIVSHPKTPLDRAINIAYTEDVAVTIEDQYIAGTSLHKISALDGMPAYGTILRWAKEHPDFRKRLLAAREVRALHFEDQAMEAADSPTDKDGVPQARLKFDAAVWAAGVNDPGTYGKKTTVSGDPNKPISFIIHTGVPEPLPAGADEAIEKMVEAIVSEPTGDESPPLDPVTPKEEG